MRSGALASGLPPRPRNGANGGGNPRDHPVGPCNPLAAPKLSRLKSTFGPCLLANHPVNKYRELRTRPNGGAHEAGRRRGALNVYAGITGCWELRLENSLVEFCGLASTKIELFDAENGRRLAMWRLEFGADDAPGCYLHVQVFGDSDGPPFPQALPIPRLPSIFIGPMAAIEYVIGELFQDQWEKAVSRLRPDQDYWRKLQGERLCCLLSWQERALKRAVPIIAVDDAEGCEARRQPLLWSSSVTVSTHRGD